MQVNHKPTDLSRRTALSLCGSGIFIGFANTPVFASGGGGEKAEKKPGTSNNSSSNAPSQNKKSVEYSPDAVLWIKEKDLVTAVKLIDQGHHITFRGFTIKMSRHLFLMANPFSNATHILIEEMSYIKGQKARRKYLKGKIDEIDGGIKEYVKNKRAENKDYDPNADERLAESKRYLAGLKTWRRSPQEGSYPSKVQP